MASQRTDGKLGVHVALLRGINVGGKNKLPMAELVKVFEDVGCEVVRTYIQSGNVVYHARAEAAAVVGAQVSARIAAEFGLKVPVVVRSGVEMKKVVKGSPFVKAGVEAESLHVMFLAEKPGAKLVAGLDRERSPGDVFEVVGREVYLMLPRGVARTKLTNAYFDSALQTVSTMRNWRTVLTLVEMCGG